MRPGTGGRVLPDRGCSAGPGAGYPQYGAMHSCASKVGVGF
jgi:hypothetical protein